jgi:hypothetical protein
MSSRSQSHSPSRRLSAEQQPTLRERTATARAVAEDTIGRAFTLLHLSTANTASGGARVEAAEKLRAELRSSVERYAIALRASGETPEVAIRSIKDTVERSSPRARREGRKLQEEIVTWAIAGYFSSGAT